MSVRESNTFLFVHSFVDDFDFTANEFRVLAHISRRAGNKSECFASVPNMAKTCRISDRTIRRVLKLLIARSVVGVDYQTGAPNRYKILPTTLWKADNHTRGPLPTTRGVTTTRGVVDDKGGMTVNTGVGVTTTTDLPLSTTTDEGDPFEGNPIKEIPLNKSKRFFELEIYDAYPRKVGKPAAIKAIMKARTKIDDDKLLEITKAYAAAVKGRDVLIPNPATWFNQERFNDEPETWLPSNSKKQLAAATAEDHAKGW